MSVIVLVDTSVFLNVLDVPGRNQQRDSVLDQFLRYIENGASLFLPLATVMESGNHIAHLAEGYHRREAAHRFVRFTSEALEGSAPWRPIQFPNHGEILGWLAEFPESAAGGRSLGDLCIVKEWERLCIRHSLSRVLIWSVDKHLQGYDRGAGR